MDSTKHIFVIENPLMDISIEETSDENSLLTKYNLKLGLASLAEEKDLPLYDELWATEGRLAVPGGSGLNTARAVNFVLRNQENPGKVVYYGSIADDEKGAALEKVLADEGVNAGFHKCTDAPTGTCGVIVKNKERTLVANLAAACKYDIDHLHNNMDNVRNAGFIYSTSFFITSNPTALHEVAQYACDNNIPFGFNFSAVFLLMFELDNVLKALRHADFLFANEDECDAFGKTQNLEGAPRTEIAKVIAKWEKSTDRPRVVIITQGPLSVIVAKHTPGTEEVEIKEYPVPQIENLNVVDTNGAGDSFVGAFLSQLWQGRDFDTAVNAGIYLSREVVQRSGCQFPDTLEL